MDKMNLYYRSPIPVQNLLTTAEGWRLRRLRFGSDYHAYRRELAQRDYSDRTALLKAQDQQFVEFVRFAASESPFYREFYAGVDLNAIRGVQDAPLLPVLEKETLRQNLESIYTVAPPDAVASSTSGTSGKSMTVYYTKRDHQRRLAYLDHFKASNGFEHLSMRRASFASPKIVPPGQSAPIFWRNNHAMKQRLYSGYHCYGPNLSHYVANLIEFEPHSIDGYPSSIYQVATYMLTHRIRLQRPPIAIFPTAETLLPHYQSSIEDAFECPVLDQYASSEGAPFVTACRLGKRHYCVDTGVIEDGGEEGSLVTGFETHGTPLIRYRIGDSIFLSSESVMCDCGTGLPLVESIEGRTHDYLIASDGHKVPAVYFSLVSEDFSNGIRAMQFMQERIGHIRVLLQTDARRSNEVDDIIEEKLHYSLGIDTVVEIEWVNHIQRDPSGKFRSIINTCGESISMNTNTNAI